MTMTNPKQVLVVCRNEEHKARVKGYFPDIFEKNNYEYTFILPGAALTGSRFDVI